MRKIFSMLSAALISTSCFPQKKAYIGIEGSIANDRVRIEKDNGGELKHVPLLAPLVGINFRQEICKNLFAEVGLLYKPYDEGMGFKLEPGYSTGTGFNSWIIAPRIGTSIKLFEGIISLVPVVGYSFCLNNDYGYDSVYAPGGSWGYIRTQQDTITYSSATTYNNKTFSLLQTGLGIGVKLFRTVNLNVSANYYIGLNKVYQLDVLYKVDNSITFSGKMVSKGQFWSVGIKLQYPVSKLWQSR